MFVVGAGASAEYGLPVGNSLKEIIATQLLNPDDDQNRRLFTAIYHASGREVDAHFAAARTIGEGLPLASSIDRYLDYHQNAAPVVAVGKLAIANSIARAEESSRLVLDENDRIGFNGINGTWLPQLFLQMQEGTRRDEADKIFENVSFVCFNYDRVIEHFFLNAVRTFSACDDREAKRVLQSLKIVHPYGRIGRLPWQDEEADEVAVAFGHRGTRPETLVRMASLIKTFSEQIADDDGAYLKARELITEAQQVVFIGFGFLDQNMRFLTPRNRCPQGASFKATAFGESDPNIELAKQAIQLMANGMVGDAHARFDVVMGQPNIEAGRFLRDYGNTLRR